jgi:long-chain acyl-CoA synthetase
VNVYYCLRRTAQCWPDRVAILHGEERRTYGDFRRRVLKVANALIGVGVQKGDRVAVLMLNCPEYLELYFATARIGAVMVPINIRLGLDETAFWLNDSDTKLLLVDDRFSAVSQQLSGRIPAVSRVVNIAGTDYESMTAAASDEEPPLAEPEDGELAGLFYTSGTTGGPKGVMLTHRNLYSNAMHITVTGDFRPDWIWVHSAPMFHLANGAAMYALTMVGAGHCFIPYFDPELLLQAFARYRATSTILVPTMVNMLMNHPDLDRYDTSSIRRIAYGASPMPLELLRRGVERFGNVFAQGYGLSEAAPLLTWLAPEDHVFTGLDRKFTPVKSAGRPVLGVDVRVVDAEDREVPPGEVGEIVARGDNVMKGYWKRPEITAQTLRGGWLHTGDMGAFDERGFLYILDRAKDMIKTGGENVYSPEVEAVLYTHPDVLEAAIIGIPDERWGESIKAAVVSKPGRELTEAGVIAYCRAKLTHFKCPTSVDFIDALPKGGTGKVQKNKLREKYWKAMEKAVN